MKLELYSKCKPSNNHLKAVSYTTMICLKKREQLIESASSYTAPQTEVIIYESLIGIGNRM